MTERHHASSDKTSDVSRHSCSGGHLVCSGCWVPLFLLGIPRTFGPWTLVPRQRSISKVSCQLPLQKEYWTIVDLGLTSLGFLDTAWLRFFGISLPPSTLNATGQLVASFSGSSASFLAWAWVPPTNAFRKAPPKGVLIRTRSRAQIWARVSKRWPPGSQKAPKRFQKTTKKYQKSNPNNGAKQKKNQNQILKLT